MRISIFLIALLVTACTGGPAAPAPSASATGSRAAVASPSAQGLAIVIPDGDDRIALAPIFSEKSEHQANRPWKG